MASSDTVTLVSKTDEQEKKGLKIQNNLLYLAVVIRMFSLLYTLLYRFFRLRKSTAIDENVFYFLGLHKLLLSRKILQTSTECLS